MIIIEKVFMEEMMKLNRLSKIQGQLSNFVSEFKEILGRSERSHWCKMYLSGLLLDGERKSIQPMSERLVGGDEQAMQQFVNQSPWCHEKVQLHLANFLIKKLRTKKGILVLDDTSLPKKGNTSVGVARQYCGALGKVANCQSIVSWHYVQKQGEHFPIFGEIYLPEDWIKNPDKLKRCGVPERRFEFKKKWELACDLLDKMPPGLSYEAIVFDAGYGEIREFLKCLDQREEIFVAQIPESHSFWPIDIATNNNQSKIGRPRQYEEVADKMLKPLSAKKWRIELENEKRKWTRIKLPLVSNKFTEVIAIRVKEVISQAFYRPGAERWLIIEKIANGTYKYYVSNAPIDTSLKQMMQWVHERWKIEQGYQQLKEELGLDHFEGRSWMGLHHHITLCFMAYAFLILLRQSHFKKKQIN